MNRPVSPVLRRAPLVLALLPLAAAGCGDDDGAEQTVPVPEATQLDIRPLDDDDLAGLEPDRVALNIPWGGGTVSRPQQPSAARATLRAARTEERGDFDRLVLEFGTEAPFPGYRVAWADTALTECGSEAPMLDPALPRPLLVRLRPAQAHEDKGEPTIRETDRRTRFATVRRARQLCDEAGLVEWLLEVQDSTSVRVLEMRDPPRLIVDVAHPGTGPAAEVPADAAGAADTASTPGG